MDAFDADVLICAAIPDHPLGRRVAALFPAGPVGKSGGRAGIGSVLLLPEVLANRFITNNTRDFGGAVKEIDVTFPADLPEPGSAGGA